MPEAWRKSTHSSQGDCVEVLPGAAVLVRDTKDREGGAIAVPAGPWREFLSRLR